MAEVFHCLGLIRSVLLDVVRYQDGRRIPGNVLDYYLISLELAYRELVVLDLTEILTEEQKEAVDIIRQCLVTTKEIERLNQLSECCGTAAVIQSGVVGRPMYHISEQSLEFLLESNFTVPQISIMFGVAISTVRRRMSDYGLSVRAHYSAISDSELDVIVSEIQQQYPMCGNRQMQGHLLSRGYRVQQVRLRDSQRRIDPSGTALRRLHVLNRRHYSVPSPLSLYHIDGNHKLIR